MKKLAIGPFKDMSGYASLGRNYIRSLFLVEDKEDWILANTLYDSGSKTPLTKDFVDAMKRKISKDVSTTVQIVTPNEMRAAPEKRNIAICCWETDRIPLYWALQLNSFDEIIVPCFDNKEAFIRSGVNRPIHVIPMPLFKEDYEISNIEPYKIYGVSSDTTIYYNIAQWTHKKGIDAAIRAYLLAFQNDENVLLVLKGYVNMMNQEGDAHKVLDAIKEIKNAMRLNKYPKIFITDMSMDEIGIKKIHKLGDCYVNFSRGEGQCIPALEALMYGNELISTQHTAMKDWVNEQNSFIIESYKDSVHNMPHPDPDLYTSKENWYEPVIISGAAQFKNHFNSIKKNSPTVREEILTKHCPEKLGIKLKEIING